MVEAETDTTTIDVECSLKSGREIFVTLQDGRDSIQATGDMGQVGAGFGPLVIKRVPEPGVEEIYTVAQDNIAYLKVTTRKTKSPAEDQPGVQRQSSFRTLGR